MTPAKILIVDDEVELERLIKQRFRKKIIAKEFEFVFAHNGAEALEKLMTEHPVDLVLTDINMPEMDGLTLLSRISEIDENLKAVVVSAYGDLPNIRAAMNRGAFDFITKPIDFQDLAITIDKSLQFVQKNKLQQQQLQQALEQLRHQAFYDQLTGLPNQNLLINRIRRCLDSEQQNNLFAVLFLSLDSFKAVKEGLGHIFSDRLLIEVARRIENSVQPTDTVARVGTDEFAVLLSNLQDFQDAQDKANLLSETLKSPFNLNETILSINSYIGIVNSTINFDQPEDFLRAADTAMNYAKTQGRFRTALFDTSMQTRTLERLQLEADLQNALEVKEFYLNYQPIISLATEKVVSFEALVRWQHPQRGLVSPVKFIPVAEETQLIIPLGKWVLKEACNQLGRLQAQFPSNLPLSMSVNLSKVQLENLDLLRTIDEILEFDSEMGSSLKLEITESILMDNGSTVMTILEQLKARNIQLSIDDFGTGYSCLAYLQSFPIDTLKIDRTFVNSIEHQEKKLDIVQTIITLAHSLNLDVIAEGVETQAQLDILRSLGCEYAQGYFFARPLDEQAVVAFLAEVASS